MSTPFLLDRGRRRMVSESESCLKLAENRAPSSLWVGGHRYVGGFGRVKTLMGLERFEVCQKFRPNSQSLGNYEGIGFHAKYNFSVFFRRLNKKVASNQLKIGQRVAYR